MTNKLLIQNLKCTFAPIRGPSFVSLMLSPELLTIPRGLSQAVVDNRSLRLELANEIPELPVPLKVINSLIEEINSTVS